MQAVFYVIIKKQQCRKHDISDFKNNTSLTYCSKLWYDVNNILYLKNKRKFLFFRAFVLYSVRNK